MDAFIWKICLTACGLFAEDRFDLGFQVGDGLFLSNLGRLFQSGVEMELYGMEESCHLSGIPGGFLDDSGSHGFGKGVKIGLGLVGKLGVLSFEGLVAEHCGQIGRSGFSNGGVGIGGRLRRA